LLFRKNRGANLLIKVKNLEPLACKRYLDQFYGYLTILDTKSTGLLTVNTIFIAILLVFLGNGEQAAKQWQVPFRRGVLELQLVLVGLSALLCLLVVRVSWRFLAKVPTAATHDAHFDEELQRLANVTQDRTLYYWAAWALALAALILTLAWWSFWYAAGAGLVIFLWSLKHG
jgi:hypothetical protein